MPEDFSHYDILGVRPDADLESIRDAYRSNAAKYHPDVNTAPNAQAMMAMLNAAWETLRDPVRRQAYDRRIATGASGASAAKPPPPNRPTQEDLDAKRRAAAAAYERAASEGKRARQEQERREAATRAADAKAVAAKIALAKAARAGRTRKRFTIVAIAGVLLIAGWAFVARPQKAPPAVHRASPAPIASATKKPPAAIAPPNATPGFSCLPNGVDVAHPAPIQLSAAQLQDLRDSYASPPVAALRAAIADSFALLAIEPEISGGEVLVVQFEHQPAKMYRASMSRLDTGRYVVHALDSTPCSPAEQHWLSVRYGAAFAQAFAGVPASSTEAPADATPSPP